MPAVALEATEIVSWLEPLPGAAMVAGANVAVMPAGGFAASAMAPLNPALIVVEIPTTPDAPWAIETDVALGVTANGAAMVNVSALVFCRPPPVPVMVNA